MTFFSTDTKALILLIEGDLDLRDLFALTLQQAGYEVIAVAYASQAFDLLNKLAFDLLVVDDNLPDQSGIQFLSQVRAHEIDIEALFLSTDPNLREDPSQFLLLKNHLLVHSVLIKPLTADDFLESVQRILDMNPRRVRTATLPKIRQIKKEVLEQHSSSEDLTQTVVTPAISGEQLQKRLHGTKQLFETQPLSTDLDVLEEFHTLMAELRLQAQAKKLKYADQLIIQISNLLEGIQLGLFAPSRYAQKHILEWLGQIEIELAIHNAE